MVIIMPQVYVDRTIVPLYLLLVPSAALPLAAIARVGRPALGTRMPAVICVLLLVATVLKMLGRLPAVDFDVLTVTLLTAAVCLDGIALAAHRAPAPVWDLRGRVDRVALSIAVRGCRGGASNRDAADCDGARLGVGGEWTSRRGQLDVLRARGARRCRDPATRHSSRRHGTIR
jgi:hypothetical protein